jgi:hypothetical protein
MLRAFASYLGNSSRVVARRAGSERPTAYFLHPFDGNFSR